MSCLIRVDSCRSNVLDVALLRSGLPARVVRDSVKESVNKGCS